MTSLGGPGVACSAMRLRRLDAGELAGDERARVEEHLAGCARCQRTAADLARERAEAARLLPFEAFAAGVAERLARTGAPARRPRWRRAVPLALAAGLAAAVAVPLVSRIAEDRGGDRVKGGAGLTVYVRAGDQVRALAPGDPVPPGAALRVAVEPAGRSHAAVALLDADGPAILYAGPARRGILPGAFEWTGEGDGTLVLVLWDRPVDAAALVRRLGQGGAGAASPGRGAEVVVAPLKRRSP
ncbi:MAG TPA: zf-HC2 domain-containing protein [Anaeromyxobacteraceae bacterium]|nr:zf-HC2 domain-containing protein [Anaeromyxobacteraceae bacterium]